MKPALLILFLIAMEYFIPQSDKFEAARTKMVSDQIVKRGISNKATIRAMQKVPRHLFVPGDFIDDAYGDYPLPISYGQTISQPFIVAYMTEAARPGPDKKVLEIGTGSGYQAAVLAEIVDTVYTIEIIPELAAEAQARFKRLGYENIICKYGDGYHGWIEYAPFDIIIVTAAASEIPEPLIDQLAENGRLIIPVGSQRSVQELILVVKKGKKTVKTRLTPVRFVPFKRL